MSVGKVWSLIPAAGDGTRLGSLTTTGGLRVPKQFCSLRGGASLLVEAIETGEAVTPRQRVLTVVAEQHPRWWQAPLESLPPQNVIVQPSNKGTAAGLLLPWLHIAGEDRRHAYLLGCAPRDADPELGCIVPAMQKGLSVAPVRRFVEKPTFDAARLLISAGAVHNMFIIAASARALLRLYAERHPGLVEGVAAIVERDRDNTQETTAARRLYPQLPTLDFSRDILEGQEPWLRVLAVPDCGWSDLGTPGRVAETLASIGARPAGAAEGAACMNLVEQHARLGTDCRAVNER